MQKYLVGSEDGQLKDKEFLIVESHNEKDAILRYALHLGRHQEWFIEEVGWVGWGEAYASKFWDIDSQEFLDLNEQGRAEAIQRFENNVRKCFAPRPEWAELYVSHCQKGRESPDWQNKDELPAEMLAAMWCTIYGNEYIAVNLKEIEVES